MQSAFHRLPPCGYDPESEKIPGKACRNRGGEEIMSQSAKHIIPAGHLHIKENILDKDNLTGVSESRALWARDLGLPRKAEYTFFAGCGYQQMKYVEGMMGALKRAGKMGLGLGKVVGITKAFEKVGVNLTNITAKMTTAKEDPYTPTLVSSISVLRKLGVDVGYMDEDEPCCGSPMYYAGFEREYAEHAKKNCAIFRSFGVRKLIGLVPGCTSALKRVYPNFVEDYDLDVQHVLEVVAGSLKERRHRPKVKEKVTVTYHDPCQLSRYLRIINEPREIINSIEGVAFVEPDPEARGKWSSCCGGGGLEATHPELSERVGMRRIEQLLKTGASVILSNCPACDMQLAKTAGKMDASVRVIDLMKFLDEALELR
jgi:Fe-S oxidoreductase